MSVLFPSLLWIGLPLVTVPILIHVLNPHRQRRIRWAAMEFLLESQRQNKKWILLTQLLLLMARMGIVALLVLMLSHIVLRQQWAEWFGRGRFHHVVLLDDSYSMSDHWENTSAFDEAKRVVQSIIDRAAAAPGDHELTLLTFSDAVGVSTGDRPKYFQLRLNEATQSDLAAYLKTLSVSERAISPLDAIPVVNRLPFDPQQSSLAVYLVSDLRARDFEDANELSTQLAELERFAGKVHFVQCVRQTHQNLAITSLEPESGIRAAGVEMWLNVTVANYSDVPAAGVVVRLQQDGHTIPALSLGEIPPRDELTHRFRVRFADEGPHSLAAELGSDAVGVDNRHYFACNLSASQPVLIVTSDLANRDARYLAVALRPGTTTQTGWLPRIESPDVLRDAGSLNRYAAICLVDVPRLNTTALRLLETYVRQGGGLAFFVGSRVDRAFYNQHLYADGEGLFPVPLKHPTQLLHRSGDVSPDLTFGDHRLFQVFAGQRNSFLQLLRVDYYYALSDGWPHDEQETASVIARVRNQAPLVIEKRVGEGLVVAQLTKLSPEPTPLGPWTNWSLNPAFPVWANELIGYLSTVRKRDDIRTVDDELTVRVLEDDYEPPIHFHGPTGAENATDVLVNARRVGRALEATFEETAKSGIYEVQLTTRQGTAERRAVAVNVAEGEGVLDTTDRQQLAKRIGKTSYEFHYASEWESGEPMLAGIHLQDTLLYGLLALLLFEQMMAFYASYHRPRQSSARGATP